MKYNRSIEFVNFVPEYTDELVTMWRTSFEKAVGISDPNPVAQQQAYLLKEVVPNNQVLVALLDKKVVGFIAATRDLISQLYVHVNYQKQGIGSRLLHWAKKQSNGTLSLYTYDSNKTAQRFYENKGFKIVERGFEPQWQLNDIKYQWRNTS